MNPPLSPSENADADKTLLENMSIVTGEPNRPDGSGTNCSQASYTRVTLPFAYSPFETDVPQKDSSVPHFRKAIVRDWLYAPGAVPGEFAGERLHYLTPETASALVERAEWFVSTSEVEKTQWAEGLTVVMRPPGLILFEWEHAKAAPRANPFATGFLVLDFYFEGPWTWKDLLDFNEIVRYVSRPYDNHRSQWLQKNLQKEIDPGDYAKFWEKLIGQSVVDASPQAWQLIPEKWNTEAVSWLSKEAPNTSNNNSVPGRGWAFYPDNRAFVSSFAVSPEALGIAKQWMSTGRSEALNERLKKNNGILPWTDPASLWVSFLNADSSDWDSAEFQLDLTAKRTYRRWAHKGTLFGYTHHSNACLVGSDTGGVPISSHFGGVYYDQLILLLYLRSVVFRFSKELGTISARALEKSSGYPDRNDHFRQEFKQFRKQFDLFTNLYQFPMLSNQQQALEMYEIARRELDVDVLFDEVEKEVKSTDEYFSGVFADRATDAGVRLGVLATIFAIIALPLSFAGIRLPAYLEPLWDKSFEPALMVLFALLILAIFSSILALKYWRRFRSQSPPTGSRQNER